MSRTPFAEGRTPPPSSPTLLPSARPAVRRLRLSVHLIPNLQLVTQRHKQEPAPTAQLQRMLGLGLAAHLTPRGRGREDGRTTTLVCSRKENRRAVTGLDGPSQAKKERLGWRWAVLQASSTALSVHVGGVCLSPRGPFPPWSPTRLWPARRVTEPACPPGF